MGIEIDTSGSVKKQGSFRRQPSIQEIRNIDHQNNLINIWNQFPDDI